MNNRLRFLFAAVLTGLFFGQSQAQTVASFEDVALPGPDTTYLHTQMGSGDGVYSFQSGLAQFYGNISYEVYWGGFNCSNHTDNVTYSFDNDAAAITGGGFDSSNNYAVSFVGLDFLGPDPTATIPNGISLSGAAAGHQVAGAYVTNTVYTYRYMTDDDYYASNGYYYRLIVRGYLEGELTADSVVFSLADFSGDNEVVVNDWTWIDLSSLGNVDSLTFDVHSNDVGSFGINTPAYFALDQLTTLDGNCPAPQALSVSEIGAQNALISWAAGVDHFMASYEIALDQSASLEPELAATLVSATSYTASDLTANTLYYAHIRTACDDGSYSTWDTVSFVTELPSSIHEMDNNSLQISISPNPATGFLDIQTAAQVTMVIYGMDGRQKMTLTPTKRVDISSLPAGLYFISITEVSTAQHRSLRFVKL